jgi:hypothetical protein
VFLLEPSDWKDLPKRTVKKFNTPDPDDDGYYKVESVIAKADVKIDGSFTLRYLFRWKGYPDWYNTFERRVDLEGTKALYEFENPGKTLSCGTGLPDKTHKLGASAIRTNGCGRFSDALKGLIDEYIRKDAYQKIYGFTAYGNG